MALQTSGAISLNDIHVEAGGTTSTSVTVNDSDVRGLISKASGAQMSFSEWYGASNSIVADIVNFSASSYRGYVGSDAVTVSQYFGFYANQGSLSNTSINGTSSNIKALVNFSNSTGTQPVIYADGGTSNSGWTSLTLSAYGTYTTSSYSGPVNTTQTWSGTFNRASASFTTNSNSSWNWSRRWSLVNNSGHNGHQIFMAAASTSNTAGMTLTWT